jgi:hypothetical protein
MGSRGEARVEAKELEDRVPQPELLLQLRRDAWARQPGCRGTRLRSGHDMPHRLDDRFQMGFLQLEFFELELFELEQLLLELLELEQLCRLEFLQLELVELELLELERD